MVWVFPGQGSQYVGMASGALEKTAATKRIFDLASETCSHNVLDLCLNADPALLARTDLCQIGVAAVSLAWMELLHERDHVPVAVAGHSLGEYCAACAAGCLTAEETLRLIWIRGQAMLACAEKTPGFMFALIGEGVKEISTILRGMDDGKLLCLANHNSRAQVVLAGEAQHLKIAEDLAGRLGVRAIPLKVTGAFHTSAMSDAEEPVAECLATIPLRDPSMTLFSGFTGKEVRDAAQVAQSLTKGITATVRWYDIQSALYKMNADPQVEVGPGKTLNHMARREYPDLNIRHALDFIAE